MNILLLLLPLAVFAASPAPEKTNYYYIETVPGMKTVLELEFPQCHKSEVLDFDRRNSLSEINKKKVRYVFLIGRLSGAHKNCSGKILTSPMTYEIEPHKEYMTHVFVVVDEAVVTKKIEGK
jgi:hypothetical protein